MKQVATSIVLTCVFVAGLGCGSGRHDSSADTQQGDAGTTSGAATDMRGSGGRGRSGGNTSSGAPGAAGMPGSGDPAAGPGQDTSCGACDGICFLGICVGGTTPGTMPAPSDAGSSAADAGQPGAACQTGSDCTSGVCGFFLGCSAPTCGDRICNGDENAKTCAGDCPERCGDGLVTGNEDCDDGNAKTERCAYGKKSCRVCDAACAKVDGATSYCGDGTIEKDDKETCDDGNTAESDGCDRKCRVEALPSCGNSAIDADEQCDDGNTANFDGCNGACHIEVGWSCPDGPGACHEICGDEMITGEEVCDDANSEDADYCSNDCRTARSCGDGQLQTAAGETCDDGNTVTESCDYGDQNCVACADDCKAVPGRYCGDAQTTDDEQCDDGNTDTESCAYGEMSCMVCNAGCRNAPGATSYCGDGRGDAANDEQCDDGNTVTETCEYGDKGCSVCNANCQNIDAARYCGDGRTTNDEQCDDGNTVTEHCDYAEMACTVCNANCQSVAGETSYCGDGRLDSDAGEQCDDGNTSDGDGCSGTCTVESS